MLDPSPSDPPYASEDARAFHRGLGHFNQGEFFEAHEAWEDVWNASSGDLKRFYQGLIQVAVTLEHVRRGNPRGVRNVYHSALTKFKGQPAVFQGVDVTRLLADLARAIDPILRLPPDAFAPGRPHGQDLPFDPQARPRIELVEDPFADDRID